MPDVPHSQGPAGSPSARTTPRPLRAHSLRSGPRTGGAAATAEASESPGTAGTPAQDGHAHGASRLDGGPLARFPLGVVRTVRFAVPGRPEGLHDRIGNAVGGFRPDPTGGIETMFCSRCSRPDAVRSRVRWYERWLTFAVRSRPYRCLTCHRRFWARPDAEYAWPLEASGSDL